MTKEDTIRRAKVCGDIFPNDEAKAKVIYKQLMKRFHPDGNDGDEDLTAKINTLYAEAQKYFLLGEWVEDTVIRFKIEGKSYVLTNAIKYKTAFCTVFHTKRTLILEIEDKKLYDKYIANVKIVNQTIDSDEKYGSKMAHLFPVISVHGHDTEKKKYYIVIHKNPDVIPFMKTVDFEIIAERTAIWIINRLFFLALYLQDQVGLVFNGLDPDLMFISPDAHTVLPLLTPFKMGRVGEPLTAVTPHTYPCLSPKTKMEKRMAADTDIRTIKKIGRSLTSPDFNDIILLYLKEGSLSTVYEEYTKWNSVIHKIYPTRNFFDWDVNYDKYYQ